jgi:hypothetical protein
MRREEVVRGFRSVENDPYIGDNDPYMGVARG